MIGILEWSEELGQGAPTLGRIYGFRECKTGEFRYVGQTTKSIQRRKLEHLGVARRGRRTPFYDWLRKTAVQDFEVVCLENVATTREDLGEAEGAWITVLRDTGDRLLNLTDGGLGPIGVKWTDSRRVEARQRNLGRKGVSMPGEKNPMWGRRHSEEQKARWSAERRGKRVGAENPNFGKFGEAHPSFGHEMSEESRDRLSAQRRGPLNPNFGKTASAETRAKMSATRRGRPMPSSVRSAHTRYHTNKGTVSENCKHCIADAAAMQKND